MDSIKNENVRGRHMLDVLAEKPDGPYWDVWTRLEEGQWLY